jgi:ADP-heptose:LPS heptosyltransferase
MKILVISLAGIGDTLLATPLIRELRANFPDAALDALVLWGGARDLLETNPHLRRVHQRNLIKDSSLGAFKFLWSLRPEGYDVTINTHPQSRIQYRFVARLIGAPLRISHEYECSGWLDRLLVNRTRAQDYARHTVENNLDLLGFLAAAPKHAKPATEVHLRPEEERWAADFLARHKLTNRLKLGVHVGSGGTKNLKLKRWPLPGYIDLIKRLGRERRDVSVLLFGGPEEAKDHERILAEMDRQLVLPANTSNLRQAGALMKRCDAFLSVDTALMHLAAAVNTRGQIVIETPTLNQTNLPYANAFTLVPNPAVAGRQLDFYRYDGGGIRGTEEELIRCMTAVTPEAVFQAINRTLAPG